MQSENTTPELHLSDKEAAALDAYAQAHGMTREEAATKLAQQALIARYLIRKGSPAQVLPFRKKDAVHEATNA